MQYVSNTGSHEYPRWSETLRDRSHVLIRPLEKSDVAAERKFFEELSPDTRRFRFLGQVAGLNDSMTERFANVDPGREMAFVAVAHDENGRERIVGVSRYRTAARGLKCECTVTVSDAWQKKGLGTLLTRHLIDVARSEGFRSMYSIDAAENTVMSDLASFLGFRTQVDPDDSRQLIHEIEL
jgi:L-amino acid N-acyltransferase YncA